MSATVDPKIKIIAMPETWTELTTETLAAMAQIDSPHFAQTPCALVPARMHGSTSAVGAVAKCAPYKLPPDQYDKWHEAQVRLARPVRLVRLASRASRAFISPSRWTARAPACLNWRS